MTPLSAVDRDALSTCLAIMEADPEFVEQQKDRPWFERASAAAYHLQYTNLRLKPWESPPMCAAEDEPRERDKAAQSLLRQMLRAGVSRYDPDPAAALAKSESIRKTFEHGGTQMVTRCRKRHSSKK